MVGLVVALLWRGQGIQPQKNQLRANSRSQQPAFIGFHFHLSPPLRNRTTRSPQIPQEGRVEVAQRDRAPSSEADRVGGHMRAQIAHKTAVQRLSTFPPSKTEVMFKEEAGPFGGTAAKDTPQDRRARARPTAVGSDSARWERFEAFSLCTSARVGLFAFAAFVRCVMIPTL